MTPRQIGGYFFLIKRRRRIEQAEMLGHMAIASRAEGKQVRKSIQSLLDDANEARR